MNKHGYKHVRKINDGRPKPYFGRVWLDGEPRQVGGGHATAREAHEAAIKFKLALSSQHQAPQGE